MSTAVLALLLFLQAIPVRPNEGGSVTGVLKDPAGKPAAHVRIGAIPVPEAGSDLGLASSMVSLAETDEAGAYRLDDVPAGRYYIAAGRVDLPTYYPGTLAPAGGRIVSVTSRATITGIDFAVQQLSARPAGLDFALPGNPSSFSVPLKVTVEGGGRLPVFSPAGFVFLRFENALTAAPTDVPINASSFLVPSATATYRIRFENLPAGYGVKSFMVGAAAIPLSMLNAGMFSFGTNAAFSIVLTPPAQAAVRTGVRVGGRAKDLSRRSIYLSGQPGTFYSDGTFEFRGVPAGAHRLATVENPESTRRLGAVVVVGNNDVDGIELEEISLLPKDVKSSSEMAITSLRSLQLSMIDEETREAAGPGTVFVTGPFGTSFDLPPDGRFQLPRLLPGTYSFEIQVFRHAGASRTVVVGDADVNLEISVGRVD